MAEYISREAANRAVLRAYALHGKGMQYIETMCQLGLVSSADVVERKTGKWIDVDDYIISGSCSACGWQAHLYEDDVVGMNFCPNCGSDMRGERGSCRKNEDN